MADLIWTPDRDDTQLGSSKYRLELCIEANQTLYVVVAGAPPYGPPPPGQFDMEASAPPLGPLLWRGIAVHGQKRGALLVGRFDPPAPGTEVIQVSLKAGDESLLTSSARRRTIS